MNQFIHESAEIRLKRQIYLEDAPLFEQSTLFLIDSYIFRLNSLGPSLENLPQVPNLREAMINRSGAPATSSGEDCGPSHPLRTYVTVVPPDDKDGPGSKFNNVISSEARNPYDVALAISIFGNPPSLDSHKML